MITLLVKAVKAKDYAKLWAKTKKRKRLKPDQKFEAVMGEYGRGALRSGSGDKVKDRDQALAIAFSEKGKAAKPVKKSEQVMGGKADTMSLLDIAQMHGVPLKVIQREFGLGLKVEREHSDDPDTIREIARDHLVDNPRYYTKGRDAGLFDELRKGLTADQKQAVINYFKSLDRPPTDDQLHEFAESLGLEAEQVEECVYKLVKEHVGMMKSRKVWKPSELLAKAKALPDGTIRTWKGKKVQKQAGKWVPYQEGTTKKPQFGDLPFTTKKPIESYFSTPTQRNKDLADAIQGTEDAATESMEPINDALESVFTKDSMAALTDKLYSITSSQGEVIGTATALQVLQNRAPRLYKQIVSQLSKDL